jgi:hypothetical protein
MVAEVYDRDEHPSRPENPETFLDGHGRIANMFKRRV